VGGGNVQAFSEKKLAPGLNRGKGRASGRGGAGKSATLMRKSQGEKLVHRKLNSLGMQGKGTYLVSTNGKGGGGKEGGGVLTQVTLAKPNQTKSNV